MAAWRDESKMLLIWAAQRPNGGATIAKRSEATEKARPSILMHHARFGTGPDYSV